MLVKCGCVGVRLKLGKDGRVSARRPDPPFTNRTIAGMRIYFVSCVEVEVVEIYCTRRTVQANTNFNVLTRLESDGNQRRTRRKDMSVRPRVNSLDF
jgi:hypothetical protein